MAVPPFTWTLPCFVSPPSGAVRFKWSRLIPLIFFVLFISRIFLFHLVHNIELRGLAAAKGAVNRYHHNKRAEQ
jgi:hypothetical protein